MCYRIDVLEDYKLHSPTKLWLDIIPCPGLNNIWDNHITNLINTYKLCYFHVREGHISSGSKLDWNLCVRLHDQTARVRCEVPNVSLRSLCLSFNSCLALTMTLNHTRLLSSFSQHCPKRTGLKGLPLMPSQAWFTPLPSSLPLWFF